MLLLSPYLDRIGLTETNLFTFSTTPLTDAINLSSSTNVPCPLNHKLITSFLFIFNINFLL